MKTKVYNVYYNDGVLCQTMNFSRMTQQEIEETIQQEILRINMNHNPLYHIDRSNFKEVQTNEQN